MCGESTGNEQRELKLTWKWLANTSEMKEKPEVGGRDSCRGLSPHRLSPLYLPDEGWQGAHWICPRGYPR